MHKLIAPLFAIAIAIAVAIPALGSTSAKQVSVKDYKFSPKKLTIRPGTKVTWTWVAHSGIPHNVTVRSGPGKFHSRTQSSGSFSHVFKKKGTYKLICTIHASLGMKLTVKVK